MPPLSARMTHLRILGAPHVHANPFDLVRPVQHPHRRRFVPTAATSTPLFDQLRTMLLRGRYRRIDPWFGDCYWTIEYRLEDHHEDDAIGIIIPSPKISTAIPMTEAST